MSILSNPRVRGKITRLEPIGNCVHCGHRILWGEPHHRVPGVLGKVCTDCYRPHPGRRQS